jgi:hypothetical protein
MQLAEDALVPDLSRRHLVAPKSSTPICTAGVLQAASTMQ